MSTSTDAVLYEVRDGVARITLNRPEKRNALNTAVVRGVRDGLRSRRRLLRRPLRRRVRPGDDELRRSLSGSRDGSGALRRLRRALHEQDDGMAFEQRLDALPDDGIEGHWRGDRRGRRAVYAVA